MGDLLTKVILLLALTEYKTVEMNVVLRHAMMDKRIPKWERRTVQINDFGRTYTSSSTIYLSTLFHQQLVNTSHSFLFFVYYSLF